MSSVGAGEGERAQTRKYGLPRNKRLSLTRERCNGRQTVRGNGEKGKAAHETGPLWPERAEKQKRLSG